MEVINGRRCADNFNSAKDLYNAAMAMDFSASEPYRTVIARAPLMLLAYAEERGLDRDELMRSAGIVEERLQDPDARMPVTTMQRLWGAVIEQAGDENLGLHAGQYPRVRQMGLLGYMLCHCTDLRQALINLARYSRIVSETVQYRLETSDETTVLRGHAHPFMVALRHPIEATFSLIISLARELTGVKLSPVRVWLPSSPPENPREYSALFGIPVSFDCPVAELEFSEEQMHLPMRDADSTLHDYLGELADSKLAELGDFSSDLVDRVRREIWKSLPNRRPDLNLIAEQVNMSPRTLQRRLREAGTSFSLILEDLRRELSAELRTNRGFAAADVAFMLGYSESSAYQRAERRWRQMP